MTPLPSARGRAPGRVAEHRRHPDHVQRDRHVGRDRGAQQVERQPSSTQHGVKLGFMSFFVKAAVNALKAFPPVNAEIDGDDVVYKNYYDIGVAVGGGKGLVVPSSGMPTA